MVYNRVICVADTPAGSSWSIGESDKQIIMDLVEISTAKTSSPKLTSTQA
jgi:hypothetical protein